jgi:hypothetical protein
MICKLAGCFILLLIPREYGESDTIFKSKRKNGKKSDNIRDWISGKQFVWNQKMKTLLFHNTMKKFQDINKKGGGKYEFN